VGACGGGGGGGDESLLGRERARPGLGEKATKPKRIGPIARSRPCARSTRKRLSSCNPPWHRSRFKRATREANDQ
jgi:hypothetical protein